MMESNLSCISLHQDEGRLSRYRKEYTLLFIWSTNAVNTSKVLDDRIPPTIHVIVRPIIRERVEVAASCIFTYHRVLYS